MNTLLVVLLWVGAAWLAFGGLASIAIVNEPRKPLGSGQAVVVVIAAAFISGTMIAAAFALA